MTAKIVLTFAGINGGFPGGNRGLHGTRSACVGWSKSSARSNERFLRSIDCDDLPRHFLFFTLTLGTLPAEGKDWTAIRSRLTDFLVRTLGATHWHHVTEWQARGVPHLHGVASFVDLSHDADRSLRRYWLVATKPWASGRRGQHVEYSEGAGGWFVYMSRHASRGVDHYQRLIDGKPEGWDGTGRMWGRSRHWPLLVSEHPCEGHVFYRIRRGVDRLVRARLRMQILAATRYGDGQERTKLLRRWHAFRLFRSGRGDRCASSCRGIDQWQSHALSVALLHWARGESSSLWSVSLQNGVASYESRSGLVVPVSVAPDRLRDGVPALESPSREPDRESFEKRGGWVGRFRCRGQVVRDGGGR